MVLRDDGPSGLFRELPGRGDGGYLPPAGGANPWRPVVPSGRAWGAHDGTATGDSGLSLRVLQPAAVPMRFDAWVDQHLAGRALCETARRARPRSLGGPAVDPANYLRCIRLVSRLRTG